MSNNDLIRRGDALAIIAPQQWSNSPVAAKAAVDAYVDAYRAINALPAVQVTDEITRLQARVKVLEDALRRLLTPFGDDACRVDHHGYCQEHFMEADCCVAYARTALAASQPADPVTNADSQQKENPNDQ